MEKKYKENMKTCAEGILKENILVSLSFKMWRFYLQINLKAFRGCLLMKNRGKLDKNIF
jgi:hypothetical protein